MVSRRMDRSTARIKKKLWAIRRRGYQTRINSTNYYTLIELVRSQSIHRIVIVPSQNEVSFLDFYPTGRSLVPCDDFERRPLRHRKETLIALKHGATRELLIASRTARSSNANYRES